MNDIDHMSRIEMENCIEQMESRIEDLTAERDALVVACKRLLNAHNHHGDRFSVSDWIDLRAAIAAVEKGGAQ